MTMKIPEPDKKLLRGVIDMHLHSAPCLYDRPFDDIECALQARDAGYRALVLKSIWSPNGDRVELVRKVVPGIHLFGGMVLNHSVGGFNPHAMRAAVGLGAKVVWMPTVHAKNHIDYFGVPTYPWLALRVPGLSLGSPPPLRVVDGRGNLLPEVTEILEIAASTNVVIATGHIDAEEIFVLLKQAREIGLDKVVCTHVGWHCTDWSLDDMKRMADMGAFLEFTINPCMPARQRRDPQVFASNILAVGPERCITSTDLGQRDNAHPVEGYRMFIRILMNNGLSDCDIDLIARRNPAWLLDLPEEEDDVVVGSDVELQRDASA
jgi:hypothetical protein